MNEHLGDEWRGTIDRALAHSPKDKVEGAYNRAQQMGRRREVFARWGELLAGEWSSIALRRFPPPSRAGLTEPHQGAVRANSYAGAVR
jgi:hypothetical protein